MLLFTWVNLMTPLVFGLYLYPSDLCVSKLTEKDLAQQEKAKSTGIWRERPEDAFLYESAKLTYISIS